MRVVSALGVLVVAAIAATSAVAVDTDELYEYLKCQLCETHAPTGPIEDCCCDVETVDSANGHHFLPILHNLTKSTYFRYFKVDLHRPCPFWPDDGMCHMRDCAVCECDPNEIPVCWRQDTPLLPPSSSQKGSPRIGNTSSATSTTATTTSELLSRVDFGGEDKSTPRQYWSLEEGAGTGVGESATYTKRNVWWSEQDSDGDTNPDAQFINLLSNPEGYTAYAGPDASRVWSAIYGEMCFNNNNNNNQNNHNQQQQQQQQHNSANGIDDVSKKNDTSSSLMCLEERVVSRVLSGLHASINTHIAMTYNDGEGAPRGGHEDLYSSSSSNKNQQQQQQSSSSFSSYTWGWMQDTLATIIHRLTGRSGSFLTGISKRNLAAYHPGSPSSSSSSSASSSSQGGGGGTTAEEIEQQQQQSQFLTLTPGLKPSVDIYIERLGKHPERLKNLYFAYLFVLRAVSKAAPTLLSLDYSTGSPQEDANTRRLVREMLGSATSSSSSSTGASLLPFSGFDESYMFQVRTEELLATCAAKNRRDGSNSILYGLDDLRDLQERYLEAAASKKAMKDRFRNAFLNVSRIMDCVGCEKCRLWGKLQFLGVGTALKILLADADTLRGGSGSNNNGAADAVTGKLSSTSSSSSELSLYITRNEAVALINLLHRLSMSISAVHVMRDLEVQQKLQSVGAFLMTLLVGGTLIVGSVALGCTYCVLRMGGGKGGNTQQNNNSNSSSGHRDSNLAAAPRNIRDIPGPTSKATTAESTHQDIQNPDVDENDDNENNEKDGGRGSGKVKTARRRRLA